MKQHPVKPGRRALRKVESTMPVVHEAAARGSPFLSFRYSYTEVSTTGGGARVRAKHARYEDGRISSEQFEGELDRGAYERVVRETQRSFLEQWNLFLRSFSRLLP